MLDSGWSARFAWKTGRLYRQKSAQFRGRQSLPSDFADGVPCRLPGPSTKMLTNSFLPASAVAFPPTIRRKN